MRVEFAATLDEMADAQLRALARSRVARSWRWQGIASTALLAGVVLYAIIPEEPTTKVVVAAVGALAGAVLYPFLYRSLVKRRLRKYCQELLGGDTPFDVTVELTPSGVCTKQKNAQSMFEWAYVERIVETSDSVDLFTRHGGIVVVRKRAFPTAEALKQFVELANRYRTDAQNAPGVPASS